MNDTFEDIRPYIDDEVDAALNRLMREPAAVQLCQYLFPDWTSEELIRVARNTHTVHDLQRNFSYKAIRGIIDRTTTGFTAEGFDTLSPEDGGNLFISNHRDIILDSAILNVVLVDHGLETAETGTGDNLFLSQVITDLLKLNRSFVISRPTQPREMYKVSQRISSYVATRREQRNSIWIAQRSGRTKNGIDRTGTGLLKMLAMAGDDFVEHFQKLNLRTLAISYEYDPCDELKAQELFYKAAGGEYSHRRKDDFKAMLKGVTSQKGRANFSLAPAFSLETLESMAAIQDKNERFRVFRSHVDRKIVEAYRLYPVHFIAADWQREEQRYAGMYSEDERSGFQDYIETKVAMLEGDSKALTQHMLDIYAGPVKSKEEFNLVHSA
ncbi:MAG: hypothetical protein AB8F95_13920 [Bacteroidia bacterium]